MRTYLVLLLALATLPACAGTVTIQTPQTQYLATGDLVLQTLRGYGNFWVGDATLAITGGPSEDEPVGYLHWSGQVELQPTSAGFGECVLLESGMTTAALYCADSSVPASALSAK